MVRVGRVVSSADSAAGSRKADRLVLDLAEEAAALRVDRGVVALEMVVAAGRSWVGGAGRRFRDRRRTRLAVPVSTRRHIRFV